MSPIPHDDPEHISLQMLAERVQILILYSMCGYLHRCNDNGTELDVDELVETICDEVRRSPRPRKYFRKKPYKANLDNPSKAFLLNKITYNKLQKAKQELLSQCRRGTLELDSQTLAIWFIANVFDHAFKLHSIFTAVAIMKILFLYDFESLKTVREFLNLFQTHDFAPNKDKLREWKSDTIREIKDWFGNGMVEVKEERVGSKTEVHFRRPANPQANFALAVECMKLFALYRYPCVLDDETKLESRRDVRKRLEAQAVSDADGIERMLMHMLSCPHDLFTVLRALEIPTDFEQRLGIPVFLLARGGGQGPISQGRRDIIKHYLDHKINIEDRLRQRDNRRNNLNLEQVEIAIDDHVRAKIFFDERKTRELELKPGDSILTVRAKDESGELPLELHPIPWGRRAHRWRPYKFQTRLQGDHKLKFAIAYKQDTDGGLTGATMKIVSIPRRYRLSHPVSYMVTYPVRAAAAITFILGITLAIVLGGRVGRLPTTATRISVDPSEMHNDANPSRIEKASFPDIGKAKGDESNVRIQAATPSDAPGDQLPKDRRSNAAAIPLTTASVHEALRGRTRAARKPDPSASSHAAVRDRKGWSSGRSFFDTRDRRATVIVRDADNKPVQHAFVVFKSAKTDHRRIDIISAGDVCGISDAKGRLVLTSTTQKELRYLKPGVYDLIVSKEKYATARILGIRIPGKVGYSVRVVLERKP